MDEYLDDHGIAVEIGDPRAIGLVITPQTQPSAIQVLVQELRLLPVKPRQSKGKTLLIPTISNMVLSPRQAWFSPKKQVFINDAVGKICGEWICPYPPGIPVLVPGEEINRDRLDFLKETLVIGGELSGLVDPNLQTVQVIDPS